MNDVLKIGLGVALGGVIVLVIWFFVGFGLLVGTAAVINDAEQKAAQDNRAAIARQLAANSEGVRQQKLRQARLEASKLLRPGQQCIGGILIEKTVVNGVPTMRDLYENQRHVACADGKRVYPAPGVY